MQVQRICPSLACCLLSATAAAYTQTGWASVCAGISTPPPSWDNTMVIPSTKAIEASDFPPLGEPGGAAPSASLFQKDGRTQS